MRGLDDRERALLAELAAPFESPPCTDDEEVIAEAFVVRGLAVLVPSEHPDFDEDYEITPLGRLILRAVTTGAA